MKTIHWLLIGGDGHGKVLPIKGGTSVRYRIKNSYEVQDYTMQNYLHRGKIYRIGMHKVTGSQTQEIPALIEKTALAPLDA